MLNVHDVIEIAVEIAASPILLVLCWWGWFHNKLPKWRAMVFLSGVCAGTVNFLLLWMWVIWLQFHYNPGSWRFTDIVSDVGIWLVLYSIAVAILGEGRYRAFLAISGILALLPWLPQGIL
ncbi:MAG: hypothetical protein ACHQJX_14290 [Candidatus Acidiferrales bacterium]|nr:hypothetical protein [Candidatus Acidoferrales bacterium]